MKKTRAFSAFGGRHGVIHQGRRTAAEDGQGLVDGSHDIIFKNVEGKVRAIALPVQRNLHYLLLLAVEPAADCPARDITSRRSSFDRWSSRGGCQMRVDMLFLMELQLIQGQICAWLVQFQLSFLAFRGVSDTVQPLLAEAHEIGVDGKVTPVLDAAAATGFHGGSLAVADRWQHGASV